MPDFKIVSLTDRSYLTKTLSALEDHGKPSNINAGPFGSFKWNDIPGDLTILFDLEQRALDTISFIYQYFSVQIKRGTDGVKDAITVTLQNNGDQKLVPLVYAKLQHAYNRGKSVEFEALLGQAASEHLAAREAALTRLEMCAAELITKAEAERERRELEFQNRRREEEERVRGLKTAVDTERTAQEQDLKRRMERQAEEHKKALDQLAEERKRLDDRKATHARREHYEKMKVKFATILSTSKFSSQTTNNRLLVFVLIFVATVFFGWVAVHFATSTAGKGHDQSEAVALIIKQGTSSLLFVSCAFFFIRWNNNWLSRNANEEFRLKRMELDIDRASWFVELAREWKEEKGEGIPKDLIDKLTHGLFTYEGDHAASEPSDSLAHMLLGASKLRLRMPYDTEVEYERKELEKLKKAAGAIGS